MSAATASSTDHVTIFVRLLDEGTDVWRPVKAVRLSEATFRIEDEQVPEDEIWNFQPGEIVVAEHRASEDGAELIAVARAIDFDEASQTRRRVA